MINMRKGLTALSAACVMAGSVVAISTPTVAAVDTARRAYYQYWTEYDSSSRPPASGDRYIILGKDSRDLKSGRPYSYSKWFNPVATSAKSAKFENRQGRSETSRYGGEWMLR